jgi:hypothetical protein
MVKTQLVTAISEMNKETRLLIVRVNAFTFACL